jgi:hypothetical protein
MAFDYTSYCKVADGARPWFRLLAIDRPKNPDQTKIPDGVTYKEAYHRLLAELVELQAESIEIARGRTGIDTLFLDGGFSDNEVFIHLLGHRFRDLSLRTTDSSLGSALGAAICISDKGLNSKFLKKNYGVRKHQPFIIVD